MFQKGLLILRKHPLVAPIMVVTVGICVHEGCRVWWGTSETERLVCRPLGRLAGFSSSVCAGWALWRETDEEDPTGDGAALFHPLPR